MGEAKRRAAAALVKKCRGCGAPLTSVNDSAAHVFPNALGGRLKPKGIICQTCNTALDKAADNALVKAFGDWPTLLNFPRDEGKHPAKLVDTRDGRRVRLEADGSMTSADVTYEVSKIGEDHHVQISAGNMKTFKQLLNRAKKEFPQFDLDAAKLHAQVVGVEDGDMLKLSLDFSPQAVFGGVITAIWLYLCHTTGRTFMTWDRLMACISGMQTRAGTFRYLTAGLPGFFGPDIPIGHKIVIRSIPQTGEMIAYVEIMGILRIGGLFASAGGPCDLIEHIYAFDLERQALRTAEFSIDRVEFEKQNWATIGLGATDFSLLQAHFADILDVFVARYQQRFTESTSSDVVDAGNGTPSA
ncbi:HNH endonuclease [Tardiphaga sp. OK246]|jgi:hypothetical protein|uniref:HNH endonuclease n=1 Tax=Tardiphaga sp. OK246 TaxID=1855307 RepID=UPI000B6E875D|nr:HNH endonuclease [Tardiphaga sp. OK246]SNT02237.1 HNH endonuclease [Tardiphaga sp. OK246]